MIAAAWPVDRGNSRIKVNSVHFENNHVFSDAQLEKAIILRTSRLLTPVYYLPEMLPEDISGLERFYRQNGYLEARVAGTEVRIDTTRGQAYLSFVLDEGARTEIESVSILGNSVIDDQTLFALINLKAGTPYLPKKTEAAALVILRFYANHGYLDAEVNPDIRINSVLHTALIDFQIVESQQYRVGEIRIKGLTVTRPNTVQREFNFVPGDIIDYSKLLVSQKKLYLTGLFQSVFIRPETSSLESQPYKDIVVEIQEGRAGEFNISVGYGTVDHLRSKVELFDINIFGKAIKLGGTAKVSAITRGLELGFTEPWTFRRPWRTDINGNYEFLHQPGYDFFRVLGRMTVGRALNEHTITSLALRQEHIRYASVRVENFTGKSRDNISSLRVNLIRDSRNNLFNPTNGAVIDVNTELVGFAGNKTGMFLRSIATLKYFLPRPHNIVWATAFEIGLINAANGIGDVPLSERFYGGGPGSLRGFPYQRVGPLEANNLPVGGAVKLVCNLVEMRFPVYKILRSAVFIDLGNVWRNPVDVKQFDLRLSAGSGIRLDTPVGLARLDWSYNLTHRPGEPKTQIYFSMGQAF